MGATVVIIMGVAGSGKTTVGRQLAETLGWSFNDADSFHPPANIAKMSAGLPLDDADRALIAALPKNQRVVNPDFAPQWDPAEA